MLTGYFSSLNDLKIEEVQFITAIALDNLGEGEAAKATLNLFSTDKNFESPNHPANVLQGELLQNYNSLLLGFIETLYNTPLVQVRKSSIYNTHDLKPVSYYIKHTTSADLYNHTMKLIASYDKNDYLILYMKTQMWFKSFSAVAGFKAASMSSEVIERLNAFFISYVNRYSKDGVYSMKTRNPDAFLITTYNNYVKEKRPEYHDIIKSESVLKASSEEDGRSLLDKFSDDDRYDTANNNGRDRSLDFINLAEKIYRASYCLYNHGDDKGIAYLDILTWYRNYLVKTYKNERTNQLGVIKNLYQVSFEDITDGLNTEATVKCRIRNDTCEVLYNKMLDGVAIYDVYNLYLEVASYADSRTNGNSGTTLFSFGAHTAKKGTNQQKFQDIYEGFIALQQLINYLNSPKNTTGYDVFNFPVTIFRDKRLLSRFQSLEDYLLLHKDVTELLIEVARNPNMGRNSSSELYSNETVYTKLLEYNKGSLDINRLINKASKLNLSSGAYIVEDNPVETFNKVIYNPICKFIEDAKENNELFKPAQTNSFLREQFVGDPVVILFKAVYFLYDCYRILGSNVYTPVAHLNASLACINIIDNMCESLQHPIDVNGTSQIAGKDIAAILDDCGVPKTTAVHKLVGPDAFCWFDFMCKVFNYAVSYICSSTVKEIHIELPFNIARLLNGTIGAIENCKNLLYSEITAVNLKKGVEPNMFLVYAKVLNEANVLNLSYPVEEVSSLISYCDKAYIIDVTSIEDMDYADIIIAKQKTAEATLEIINRCIKHYEPLFIVFKEFLSNAKNTLTAVGSATGVSASKYKMMANLSLRIQSEYSRNMFANQLYKLCQDYNCHYDNNGYLMKNRDYVTLDNGTKYVHEYGYKILPGIKDEFWVMNVDPEIHELTNDDLILIDITIRSM